MIKASLLLAICWAAMPALRRRSAAERHLLWATALAAAAALPLLTFVLPPWRLGSTVLAALPASLAATPLAFTTNDVDVVVRANAIEAGWTIGRALSLAWIAGAAAIFFKLGVDAWKLARLARSAGPVRDARWTAAASDIAHALGMTRRHRLLESPIADMPMTWGLWPAHVLLPACPTSWSDERRRAVIAHELAHVSRLDWLVQLGVELACAVYWFNPLFWMARGSLYRESERACDDLVLSLGIDNGDYAAHLLGIARMGRAPVTPALGMARPSGLERRLTVLLDANVNRRAVTRVAAWSVLAACILLVVPLAAVSVPEADTAVDVRTANLPLLRDSAPNTTEIPTTPPEVRLVSPGGEVAWTQTAPQIVEYPTPPLYSDEARARQVEGIVTIQAKVDEHGDISALRVVRGLGFGLDQNALVALRQWRFRPGTVRGRPVDTIAEIDVEFSLSHEALNELIANDMATRVGPGVTPPRVVRTVAVRRPSGPAGRQAGSVLLDVVLLEDGTPRIVRMLRALNPDLDDRAVRAFEQWRFSPAMKGGRPVKVRLNAEVHFRG